MSVMMAVMMAMTAAAAAAMTATVFPMLSGGTSLLSTLHPDSFAFFPTIIMEFLSFSFLLLLPLLDQTRHLFIQLTQTHLAFPSNTTINLFLTISIPSTMRITRIPLLLHLIFQIHQEHLDFPLDLVLQDGFVLVLHLGLHNFRFHSL